MQKLIRQTIPNLSISEIHHVKIQKKGRYEKNKFLFPPPKNRSQIYIYFYDFFFITIYVVFFQSQIILFIYFCLLPDDLRHFTIEKTATSNLKTVVSYNCQIKKPQRTFHPFLRCNQATLQSAISGRKILHKENE